MAVGNTKYDLDLISAYISDIDVDSVGLSQSELNDILSMTSSVEVEVESLLDNLLEAKES